MEGMEQDGSAAAAVRAAGGSASGGARAEAEPDNEVLALVCPPVSPAAAFNKMVGDNEAASEHMNDLSMRRESLKFVLARTLTNLAYFTEQCKSNPSCEVRRRLPPPPPPRHRSSGCSRATNPHCRALSRARDGGAWSVLYVRKLCSLPTSAAPQGLGFANVLGHVDRVTIANSVRQREGPRVLRLGGGRLVVGVRAGVWGAPAALPSLTKLAALFVLRAGVWLGGVIANCRWRVWRGSIKTASCKSK